MGGILRLRRNQSNRVFVKQLEHNKYRHCIISIYVLYTCNISVVYHVIIFHNDLRDITFLIFSFVKILFYFITAPLVRLKIIDASFIFSLTYIFNYIN